MDRRGAVRWALPSGADQRSAFQAVPALVLGRLGALLLYVWLILAPRVRAGVGSGVDRPPRRLTQRGLGTSRPR